jgi:hypothetical protein
LKHRRDGGRAEAVYSDAAPPPPQKQRLKKARGLLTRIYLTGTYGLVYLGRPVKDVDNYKDSKIDLEAKKESYNPYSTRTLVNP